MGGLSVRNLLKGISRAGDIGLIQALPDRVPTQQAKDRTANHGNVTPAAFADCRSDSRSCAAADQRTNHIAVASQEIPV